MISFNFTIGSDLLSSAIATATRWTHLSTYEIKLTYLRHFCGLLTNMSTGSRQNNVSDFEFALVETTTLSFFNHIYDGLIISNSFTVDSAF